MLKMDKKTYFDKLAALRDISEDEEESDTRDDQEILQGGRRLLPLPSSSHISTPEITQSPAIVERALVLHRSTSAPVSRSTLVGEAPPLPKPSFQSETITHTASRSSPATETLQSSNPRLQSDLRPVSDPTTTSASLILPYSMGIESMLGRKRNASRAEATSRKKKSVKLAVKLVPEEQRIFKDKTFYYVPPDDVALLRKNRIIKAQEYGATWAREITPEVTHIVVEKPLTYEDVMDFLKVETLPEGVIMVKDDYPIDCIKLRSVLDPLQERYAVNSPRELIGTEDRSQSTSQSSGESLRIKATKERSRKGKYLHADQTPPKSQESIDVSRSEETTGRALIPASQKSWITPINKVGAIVENSLTISPTQSRSHEMQGFVQPRDELDKMIKMAQAVEDIPISDEENDEEDEQRPSRDTSEEPGSELDLRSRGKSKKRRMPNSLAQQQNFICMTGGTGATLESNPNARTIEVLQQMCDYYIRTKDHWRQTAYRRAIGLLKKQTTKIATYEQAVKIPSIGNRLAKKIEEIVLTDSLRRLKYTDLEPNDCVLQGFMNIYGVGLKQGLAWVAQGHKTLEDLKRHASLTVNQRLGIEHYDDFLTRIPRDEVTRLGEIIRTNSAAVDPKVEVVIGGSYRRGAASSGDIDCLLTKPGTSSSNDLLPFLNRLVARLTETGFLVAALAAPSIGSQSGSKWHGCCVLPGSAKPIWRRIDLLLVPETELGAALIYFTGDDIFNRSIRLLASRKGWRLNQRGLYEDVMRGPGGTKITEGSLIEGVDEKKIFALLGVPWRPPEQRTCH